MRKARKFLSMAVVVSMIAALPASSQSIPAMASDSNLSLLVSVNRLELTQEQMVELHDILSSLLETRSELDASVDAFEQVMIEFSGTNEELDALLATFREEQRAQAETMREAVTSSLDAVGDLLSINQGMILRDELPELLGAGHVQMMRMGSVRFQEMPSQMGQRMSASAMGRRGMMFGRVGSHLQGGIESGADGVCDYGAAQSSSQNGYWNEVISSTVPVESERRFGLHGMQSSGQSSLTSRMMQSSAERELMLRGLQTGQWPDLTSSTMENRAGRTRMLQLLQDGSDSELPEMLQQRLGQGAGDEAFGELLDQLESRIELHGEQMPEEPKGRLGQHMSGSVGFQDGTAMMMRGQAAVDLRHADRGSLFDLLEDLVEILELKLDALE